MFAIIPRFSVVDKLALKRNLSRFLRRMEAFRLKVRGFTAIVAAARGNRFYGLVVSAMTNDISKDCGDTH